MSVAKAKDSTRPKRRILLADDDPHEVELTMRALKSLDLDDRVDIVSDGEQALDYLYGRGDYAERGDELPAVILLDLKMPKVDGLGVLDQIKSDPDMRTIPVVMLTSSDRHSDVHASYSKGTNAYVVKPMDFREYIAAIKELGSFWAIVNEPPPA